MKLLTLKTEGNNPDSVDGAVFFLNRDCRSIQAISVT